MNLLILKEGSEKKKKNTLAMKSIFIFQAPKVLIFILSDNLT